VGLLFVLLCAIAWLQFHWIGQVTEAERQRARSRLDGALSGFAADFDIETTRAFATFAVPYPDGPDYSQRYQEWTRLAPNPGLILGAYVLDTGNHKPSLKALTSGEPTIDPAVWQRDLKPLISQGRAPLASVAQRKFAAVGSSDFVRGGPRFGGSIEFVGIPQVAVDGNPTFVFPVMTEPVGAGGRNFLSPPPPARWMVVVLDAAYIKTAFLPRLAQLHFGAGPAADYDLLVRTRAQTGTPQGTVFHSAPALSEAAFTHPDGSIGLFELRMDCFSPSPGPKGFGPGEMGMVTRAFDFGQQSGPSRSNSRGVEILRAPSQIRVSGIGALPEILARTPSSCANPRLASERQSVGFWQLLVRYRAGSLDQVVAGFRHRSLLLSGAVLMVLAGGVLMLIISTERARALAEMQTEFVLGVSHELRTPLSVIRVAADNLRRGMVENAEQARRYGLIIDAKASELSSMIEETLVLARMQATTSAAGNGATSVERAVKASLEAWEGTLRDAGMQVEIDLAPDLPPVSLNARLLGSCLDNLIQNVVRYASAGRWMAILARKVDRREGQRVQISVEDGGPGIARVDLPHVFESFYRGKRGEASHTPGMGLGLTLVKRVVEAHRGTVEVETSDTTGTRFSLLLPVSLPVDPRNAEPMVVHEPANTAR